MYLWEEADYIALEYQTMEDTLSHGMYTYGLFAAMGAAVMMLILYALMEAKKMPKGSTALTGVLSIFLGTVFSKVFFALFSLDGLPILGKLRPDLFTGGGHSMMGALFGGFAGAALSGLVLKKQSFRCMDIFAAAVPAFILFARLGEQFDLDGAFGISRPLTHPFSAHLPAFLLQEGDYANYLLVYKLEAIAAALILVVLLLDLLLHKNAKPGDTFILFLLLFGGSQAILESLRQDKHLTLSFVHLQQIMAIPMLVAGVVMAAVRAKKDKRFMRILSGCLFGAVVLGVLLELTIYRPDMTLEMDIYLIYTLFAVLVAALVYVGLRLRKGGSLIPWKKRK